MAKRKKLDSPQKVRTTVEELEVLARLKNTVEWAIVKRLTKRYIAQLRKASFKLDERDPNYLAARHADFAGQAFGMKMVLKMVDNSGKKLENMEDSEKKDKKRRTTYTA